MKLFRIFTTLSLVILSHMSNAQSLDTEEKLLSCDDPFVVLALNKPKCIDSSKAPNQWDIPDLTINNNDLGEILGGAVSDGTRVVGPARSTMNNDTIAYSCDATLIQDGQKTLQFLSEQTLHLSSNIVSFPINNKKWKNYLIRAEQPNIKYPIASALTPHTESFEIQISNAYNTPTLRICLRKSSQEITCAKLIQVSDEQSKASLHVRNVILDEKTGLKKLIVTKELTLSCVNH